MSVRPHNPRCCCRRCLLIAEARHLMSCPCPACWKNRQPLDEEKHPIGPVVKS